MKILNTLITLGCLGGLVSCYPVAGTSANAPAALKKKTVSTTSPSTAVNKKVTKTSTAAEKEVTSTANTKTTAVTNSANDVVKENTPTKSPAPKVVKNASKVPGKEGFVFNPYTNNQVDVRGIPSGTKVRDPHDSNPAHIFRVP